MAVIEENWTGLTTAAEAIATGSLDSLADGSGVLGADIGPHDDLYVRLELALASVDLSAQDNPSAYVYYIKSDDGGSTFEDGAAAVEPARMPDAIFPLREVNAAQRVMIDASFPPENFKVLVFNHAGAAWAASGNTLYYSPFTRELNS